MDSFLNNLKTLLEIFVNQTYGTPLFWGVLVIAVVALFFVAGMISRTVFGIDGGLVRTFVPEILIAIVFLVASAATLTWIQPSLVTACAVGGILAAGTLYGVRKMMGGKTGPAVGITIFSLGLFALVAHFGGGIASSLANKAETLKPANDPKFEKAK